MQKWPEIFFLTWYNLNFLTLFSSLNPDLSLPNPNPLQRKFYTYHQFCSGVDNSMKAPDKFKFRQPFKNLSHHCWLSVIQFEHHYSWFANTWRGSHVGRSNNTIRHLHISHNAPYLPPTFSASWDIDSEPNRVRGITVNQPGRRYVICKPAMQFVILQIFWVFGVDPFLRTQVSAVYGSGWVAWF